LLFILRGGVKPQFLSGKAAQKSPITRSKRFGKRGEAWIGGKSQSFLENSPAKKRPKDPLKGGTRASQNGVKVPEKWKSHSEGRLQKSPKNEKASVVKDWLNREGKKYCGGKKTWGWEEEL